MRFLANVLIVYLMHTLSLKSPCFTILCTTLNSCSVFQKWLFSCCSLVWREDTTGTQFSKESISRMCLFPTQKSADCVLNAVIEEDESLESCLRPMEVNLPRALMACAAFCHLRLIRKLLSLSVLISLNSLP